MAPDGGGRHSLAPKPPLIRYDQVTPEGYEALLAQLASVFANASVGDFAKPVEIPVEETPYTPILVGVEVMRQVIQGQIGELETLNTQLQALNAGLERKVIEKSAEVVESEEKLRGMAIARPLVRTMIRRLIDTASIPPATLRSFGEELSASVQASDLNAFVEAFEAMGLGTLEVEGSHGPTMSFRASDLIERRDGTRMTTCFLTTGFLVGAVSRVLDAPAVAGEVTCQSRGDAACRFVARAKLA